jgi:hypothetical protein
MDVNKIIDDELSKMEPGIYLGRTEAINIIHTAIAQDRKERPDTLSAKLIKLAARADEGTKWVWLDIGLTLVYDNVFGLASDTPLEAVDRALKGITDSP